MLANRLADEFKTASLPPLFLRLFLQSSILSQFLTFVSHEGANADGFYGPCFSRHAAEIIGTLQKEAKPWTFP